MLKKSISYTNYNDEDVVEDFYFNFTKVEMVEMMEVDELEKKINRLTETQDTKEAYAIFKDLVLNSYGKKSDDGRRFIKSPELRLEFEQSPAMSELILEFLNNPALGARFIEGTLPAKLVAEVKASQATRAESSSKTQDIQDTPIPELKTAQPELAPSEQIIDVDPSPRVYSYDELVTMSQEDFQRIVGSDPKQMSHEHLIVAMDRKNRGIF